LWYENLDVDGRFLIEAAPATSLYHVVGAITELWTFYGAHAVRATQSDAGRRLLVKKQHNRSSPVTCQTLKHGLKSRRPIKPIDVFSRRGGFCALILVIMGQALSART
jgi:hypothetical protein